MASMSESTRKRIVEVAKANGFSVELKEDGRDLYVRNLAFRTRSIETRLYIHRVIGINATSGDFSYLKVAVHPKAYRHELIASEHGIHECINVQEAANRHHSSNYRGFPTGIPGRKEPYGSCYKVTTLPGLAKLLAGLAKGI